MEGNADFAGRYWPVLTRWAEYLRDKGFDPENQLSTDDFAGHLAHNVNLSAKAITALGAFAQLSGLRGDKALAVSYWTLAERFAREEETCRGGTLSADDAEHADEDTESGEEPVFCSATSAKSADRVPVLITPAPASGEGEEDRRDGR